MRINFPVREIIFGLEDSIVSTLGVVVGIAAGTDSRYMVVLSALIIIVVESLSMTAGTYLSNKSEMEINHTRINVIRRSLADSLSMAISYILGGVISVLPFFYFSPLEAIVPAVILSFAMLFAIGYVKGKMAKINSLRSGLEMSLVSLTAAVFGYLIGVFGRAYLIKI